MDIRSSLKGQYHAGLAMLRQAVERCPEEIWLSGGHPRNFWRIAYHAVFYVHLYLGQNEDVFQPWDKHRPDSRFLYENPAQATAYTSEEILGYIDQVNGQVDATIDGLDLDTEEPGFSWYKRINKLDHEIMNLRHLQVTSDSYRNC